MRKRKTTKPAGHQSPVRLIDLSRELGVSLTTISRALRDKPGVSAVERSRIKKAAKQLGYVSNKAGAALSTGRVYSIGYIIPKQSDSIAGQLQVDVMSGMLEVLAQHGYSLSIYSEDYFRTQDVSIFEAVRQLRVDALAITIEHSDPIQPPDQAPPSPVVVINRRLEGMDANFVLADEERGGEIAVEHLLKMGHRHIAYIGGPTGHAALSRRQSGYVNALSNARIAVDPDLVEHAPAINWRGGHAACKALLARTGKTFTAMFCGSDVLAVGALKYMEEQGISVPEEVAVVSFDDSVFADITDPELTSVRKLRQIMGQEAARLIMRKLNGEMAPSEVVLPVELIVRKSCGSATATR